MIHNSQTHHLLLPSTAQTKLIFLLPTYWICTSSLNFTSLLFLSRRSTLGAPAVGPRQRLLVAVCGCNEENSGREGDRNEGTVVVNVVVNVMAAMH